jgi:serine/threonine-protein kinase ATR
MRCYLSSISQEELFPSTLRSYADIIQSFVDPFAQDQQRQQGIDSIAALNSILQQKPHLLLSAKEGHDDTIPRPPLILWLYPKLLGLLTHAALCPVYEPVRQLLGLCLCVLPRTSALWRQVTAVFQLYRSCVQSILAELNLVDDPASASSTPFSVLLPSSSSISEFWPESQQFVALPHDLQRAITSQLGAIHIGFSLLLALVDVVKSTNGKGASLEHHLPWVLDSLQALWQHFRRWTTSSEKRPFYDEITGLYLQLLDSALFPNISNPDRFSNSLKAAQALTGSLSELLQNSATSPVSESNQIRLATTFARLLRVLKLPSTTASASRRRQDGARGVILNDLETVVSAFCQDTNVFSSLHRDLQVRNAHPKSRSGLTSSSWRYVSGPLQVFGLCILQNFVKNSTRVSLEVSPTSSCPKSPCPS